MQQTSINQSILNDTTHRNLLLGSKVNDKQLTNSIKQTLIRRISNKKDKVNKKSRQSLSQAKYQLNKPIGILDIIKDKSYQSLHFQSRSYLQAKVQCSTQEGLQQIDQQINFRSSKMESADYHYNRQSVSQKIYKFIYDNPIHLKKIRNLFISPQNPYIMIWNIFLLIIILYFIMEAPLLLAFGEIVWEQQLTVLWPLLIFFYLALAIDILITPLKMYYKNGFLIKQRKYIFDQYFLKKYFWIDVIGLLSVLIPVFSPSTFALNITRIFFYPKILTVNTINQKIKQFLVFSIRIKTLYLIGRLVVFIIVVAHYFGLGFYMVDLWIYKNNYFGPNTPNICWLYNAQSYSQIWLLLDWKGQYVYMLYYSIGVTNTIAYGDVTPLNPIQTLYTVFILICNAIIFGYILSEVLRVLMQAFYAHFQKSKKSSIMETLIVKRKIPQRLVFLIRGHMQQLSQQQIYRDRAIEREVIDSLPLNLKVELQEKIFQDFLKALKLHKTQIQQISAFNNYSNLYSSQDKSLQRFQNHKNNKFLENIINNIFQCRFLAGDFIFHQNEEYSHKLDNHRAYYLKNVSQVQEIVFGVGKQPKIDLQDNQIIDDELLPKKPNTLQSKSIIFPQNKRRLFGEIQFLTGKKRKHFALAKINILLYYVSRDVFLSSLRYVNNIEYQYIRQMIEDCNNQENGQCIACQNGIRTEKKKSNNRNSLQANQQISGIIPSHMFTKCPVLTYKPNIIALYRDFLKRQQEKRKVRHNNIKIFDIRSAKKLLSEKNNALTIFTKNKQEYKSKNHKKFIEKSKIKMLISHHQQKKMKKKLSDTGYFFGEQNNELHASALIQKFQQEESISSSDQSSYQSDQSSEEDLQFFIKETKILIDNLEQQGKGKMKKLQKYEKQLIFLSQNDQNVQGKAQLYVQTLSQKMDEFYYFEKYRPWNNYEIVLKKFNNLQVINQQKKAAIKKSEIIDLNFLKSPKARPSQLKKRQ